MLARDRLELVLAVNVPLVMVAAWPAMLVSELAVSNVRLPPLTVNVWLALVP